MVLIAIIAMGVYPRPGKDSPSVPLIPNLPTVRLNPDLELTVWTEAAVRDNKPGQLLFADGRRPLRPGYGVRIQIIADKNDSSRKAYFYILWLDAAGKIHPIYPWREKKWEDRPEKEEARAVLWLPTEPVGKDSGSKEHAMELIPGATGVEAVVLLATDQPLGAAADRFRELTGWEDQRDNLPDPLLMAYLEDGKADISTPSRAPSTRVLRVYDPVKSVARLMSDHFVPLGSSRAVCFGFQSR